MVITRLVLYLEGDDILDDFDKRLIADDNADRNESTIKRNEFIVSQLKMLM